MQIDRLLVPVTTLGPGNRLVIWTIGCSKRCVKCANPELWNKNLEKNVSVENLIKNINMADNTNLEGITITGGDPLEQIDELNIMLPLLREKTDDILVYTGFTVREAKDIFSKSQWEIIENNVSVLIDGPYIDELNDNKCVLRGSTNQNIIYFDETKEKLYKAYMEKGRSVQNVFYNNRMISVGIHNNDL